MFCAAVVLGGVSLSPTLVCGWGTRSALLPLVATGLGKRLPFVSLYFLSGYFLLTAPVYIRDY